MPPNQIRINGIRRLPRFDREMKGLKPDLLKAAKTAIEELYKNPSQTSLRLHCVNKEAKPKIFTIDVLSNKSYKISFHMEGEIAVLRRVASHKDIDRLP